MEPCNSSHQALDKARSDQDLCDVDVVNRLPPELLFAIFDEVCNSEWQEQSKAMQRDRFPSIQFALGHVCRRWYTLIQSTPSLWSKYSLTLSGDTKRTYVPFLQYCLPRSKACPLSIRIQQNRSHKFNVYHHDAYSKTFAEVMDVLAPHSERWREVTFYVPGFQPCGSFKSVRGRLPMLESLSIQMSSVRLRPCLQLSELDMFEGAPRLTRVNYPTVSDKLKLRLDWSTLTTFSCDAIAFTDALGILREAQNLSRCTLSVFYYSPSVLSALGYRLTLPNLQYLALKENCRYSEFPLLNRLTIPNLQMLITNAKSPSSVPIVAFLERSACQPKIVAERPKQGGANGHWMRNLMARVADAQACGQGGGGVVQSSS
ncbi:hypothetical protein BKA70DRAFT_1145999 [Coprinopsis sp. MPI-PUGE-AT-0042]|nr:hypothetical protein BKA70DRAFT_1145999 [Coprinopsis sp. MPI-PUGE-AT-0042]